MTTQKQLITKVNNLSPLERRLVVELLREFFDEPLQHVDDTDFDTVFNDLLINKGFKI